MIRAPRRHQAVIASLVLAVGLAACGSSDGGASDATTTTKTADAATTTTTEVDDGACAIYPVDDMNTQMGVDDVTAESTSDDPPTCTYTSEAHYLSAEVAMLTKEQYDAAPSDPSAFLTGDAASSAKVLPDPGIGDESFAYAMNGGVFVAGRVGDVGYSVLATNAGGGDDAGNWTDDATMVASATAIIDSIISHS